MVAICKGQQAAIKGRAGTVLARQERDQFDGKQPHEKPAQKLGMAYKKDTATDEPVEKVPSYNAQTIPAEDCTQASSWSRSGGKNEVAGGLFGFTKYGFVVHITIAEIPMQGICSAKPQRVKKVYPGRALQVSASTSSWEYS